ncbi:MAG: hypothetical protein AB7K52_01480 [Phycisphaerales bacterium]
MPANRSRTHRWRDLLDQVASRGGALEIAFQQPRNAPHQPDVVWRVRILQLDDRGIVVESPSVAGRSLSVQSGAALVGTISVGQNRWMFLTRAVGYRVCRGSHGHEVAGLTLELPEQVERCTRRQFFRVSAAELQLPRVQVWPLLDPSSVVAAETANKNFILEALEAARSGSSDGALPADPASPESILLPQVGPMFQAHLLNMSGGGLGLMLGPGEAATADRHHAFWLRIDLRPQIPLPLAVSAKRVHCHLDSHGHTYAGMAFDFTFNPGHQRFVTELMTQYLDQLHQRQQNAAAG